MKSPKFRLMSVAAMGLAASLLVSTAAVADSSSGVAAAKKFLIPYESPNPVIKLPTLTAKPPRGKTIDFLTCPVTICISIQDGVQAAAKALGWHVRVINIGLTPAGFISAMNAAVQNPGSAVLGIGAFAPNTAIASQLAALKAKGVPWIADVSPSPVGQNDMIANEGDTSVTGISGTVMANWVVANSNGNANVAFFWDPEIAVLNDVKANFLSTMTANCPACTVSVQSTSFYGGIGTTDPGQIVSYLQANPTTNYLVVTDGDAMVGVTQAIAAAGLAGKVKIVTRSADVINIKDIAAGTETMGLTSEGPEAGWRMVDVAARYFLHDSLKCCSTPTGTFHIVTSADMPVNINVPYTVPHYQSYFLKAWRPVKVKSKK